mmetsp:Transcript_5386/g.7036  ORF Transcript_5386/g.7036 Transcript_5386/m.7036 type:complete len:127 (+) Transcript_5386:280-660(+)
MKVWWTMKDWGERAQNDVVYSTNNDPLERAQLTPLTLMIHLTARARMIRMHQMAQKRRAMEGKLLGGKVVALGERRYQITSVFTRNLCVMDDCSEVRYPLVSHCIDVLFVEMNSFSFARIGHFFFW